MHYVLKKFAACRKCFYWFSKSQWNQLKSRLQNSNKYDNINNNNYYKTQTANVNDIFVVKLERNQKVKNINYKMAKT